MIWVALAAVYVIGFVIVAGALREELAAKPRVVALVIVCWPLLIVLAVALFIGFALVKAQGSVELALARRKRFKKSQP